MSMFSMFGSYSRYASYHRDSSSDEEEPSSFTLQPARGGDETTVNAALEAALESADTEGGRIALETEGDGMDVDALVAASLAHLCVECRDQPAALVCAGCDSDIFCDVCYPATHRRGARAKHETTPYVRPGQDATAAQAGSEAGPEAMDESTAVAASSAAAADAGAADSQDGDISDDDLENAYQRGRPAAAASSTTAAAADAADALTGSDDSDDSDDDAHSSASGVSTGRITLPSNALNSSLVGTGAVPEDWFLNRARYIPLRLTLEERKFLRLLEAALNVSEYTDKIDIVSNKDKLQRIKEQLRDICSILSGLVVANDYKLGQALLKNKEFADNADFFRNVFELGRRHKVRNPEKLRSVYGKLVFILQDSVNPTVEDLMGFNLYAPLKTVYSRLEAAGALAVLRDPRMSIATGDIKTDGRQRPEIERDIKQKEAAVTYLARTYMNQTIDEEGMRACILSVADNSTFLIQNRHCCDTMLEWLQECFHPTQPQAPWSLAILGGRAGARLTHSHANQYAYVLQSLMLWREILHDMFGLWVRTEEDLMDPQNPYRLRNTGQGLNRVQQAPRIGKAMHNILAHCQRKLGNWIGSSVIHLGDHNVPNALVFIDKYNQVPRILNPIVLTIKAIPRLCEKKDIKFYIDSVFGGPEKLKMLILSDFFRHAFDGSGSDNFFDAGSCIDGRLTSAWNWCNKVEKKSYYSIFQLAGFSSFDGQWSE